MNISIKNGTLKAALKILSTVIAKENSVAPELSNILLEIENGQLKMTGTNLETQAIIYIHCQMELFPAKHPIRLHIPFATFSKVVRSMGGDQTTIAFEETQITVNVENTTVHLLAVEEHMPLVAPAETGEAVWVRDQLWRRAIQWVAPYASTDDLRPAMTGIFLETQNNKISMTATNGYALATYATQAIGTTEKSDFILPPSAISALLQCNQESERGVLIRLHEDKNFATIQSGNTTLTCRLIDVRYPDYKKVIPDRQQWGQITVNTKDAWNGAQVAKLTSDISNTISIETKQGFLYITSDNAQKGDTEAKILQDGKGSVKQKTSFNGDFLIQVLSTLKEANETTYIEWTAIDKAVLFSTGEEALILIMPILHD